MRYAVIWCSAVAALCAVSSCNPNSLGGSNVDGGNGDGGNPISGTLDVQPGAVQTVNVTVTIGQPMTPPTVTYNATWNGQPIAVGWTVDRSDIGSVVAGPNVTTTFTPTGTTAGLATVSASVNGQTVTRQIQVNVTTQQNGVDPNPGSIEQMQQVATSAAQLTVGGGIGGVGGEGLGPAVTDQPTLNALNNPSSNGQAQKLTLLYPYDQTVWPRGLLAPLLMWNWSTGDADAIKIQISSTSGAVNYTGTFGRPTILGTTGKFIRHPIPQDAWDTATNSAGGKTQSGAPDQLKISITIAKGGMGYGPISETWTVAPARPAGTIYYNSYGTLLVLNSTDNSYVGKQYGAAVLSIKAGDTAPSVVAGTKDTSMTGAGCRVCHVAASSGNKLIVQHGDNYTATSVYDLKNGNTETKLSQTSTFAWAGLLSDASLAFTNTADLAASASATQLYNFPPGTTATPITVNGIPTNLQAGTPTFSPDGTHVAFDFLGGTIGALTGNPSNSRLVALDYSSTNNTFSNLRTLIAMPGTMRAGFPSFLPTNDKVIFHYQTVNSNHRYNTWHGAQAQVWTSDLATGNAVVLSALNGLGPDGKTPYLPALSTATNHTALGDTTLNYEPVVAPIAAGGYAWVIFTSRRIYGNLATTDPWQSDPRNYDATQYANITCKKLWVSAIDLNAPAGTDISHPAFYLPAQEIIAGNARGFWVLDPCRPLNSSCQTGDQCCSGYCEPEGVNGANICTSGSANQCSMVQEHCTTSNDCCDRSNLCINNFCSTLG